MAKASSFRDLVVWQKAMALAARVYRMTAQWPKTHQFGLGSQVQRSATSIPANIAEGFERHSRKEYQRFLAIAAGSAAETVNSSAPFRDGRHNAEERRRRSHRSHPRIRKDHPRHRTKAGTTAPPHTPELARPCTPSTIETPWSSESTRRSRRLVLPAQWYWRAKIAFISPTTSKRVLLGGTARRFASSVKTQTMSHARWFAFRGLTRTCSVRRMTKPSMAILSRRKVCGRTPPLRFSIRHGSGNWSA